MTVAGPEEADGSWDVAAPKELFKLNPTSLSQVCTVVFPLPLTPFEYYYFSDDRPAYPTTYPVDLRLRGRLARDTFLLALRQALDRHPLLDARIDDRTYPPQWVPSERQMPLVDWADELVPITHPDGEYIDLRTNPGLRVWVRTGDDTARVLFQFHHACCDGLASFRFVEDLFIAYRLAIGGADDAPRLPQVDIALLKDRGRFAAVEANESSLRNALRDAWATARVWTRVLLDRSALLAVPNHQPHENSDDQGHGAYPPPENRAPQSLLQYETASLSSDEIRQLRRVARVQDATLNDLLLRDLFLAMRAWNQQHNGSHGIFRVNVPVNLRDRTDRRMPAANRLSFAFVTKDLRNFDDRRKLLTAISDDTVRIKQWKLGLYYYGGLAVACHVPNAVPWALNRKYAFATVVFSNLGRVYVRSALSGRGRRLTCGNLVLERVTGAPPLRPLTRAAIAIVEYGDEANINLRCDPHLFSTTETRALLASYVRQLKETLERGN